MVKRELLVYPAVFDNEENNGYYTVSFPDVPNTVTQGKTLEEAFTNTGDALGVALLDYATYPKASDLLAVQKANPGKPVSLVSVDMAAVRRRVKNTTVRKNVTIPQMLAEEADEHGINYSEVLREALQHKLNV
ncbi:hypothetical protein ADT67_12550 [Levilactobacillus brevis]|nr:type II toxin-antitoxin system HicB family antitoxin [Levilactobacillus brevis]KIO93765.1 Phage-related protein [Levilactobacillus brevis]KIO95188.1 Phage-related protein [Levilactobacillus brevis]OLF66241.1 hypothetical protein ADT67_12550 [Levilactobacillus brevis]